MTALALADSSMEWLGDDSLGFVFVDSNVLLYAVDEVDPEKQRVARNWRAELWKSRRGRVSSGARRILRQRGAETAGGA